MTENELQLRLGIRIKAIRIKKKMTQNELSKACGIEKASMSRIESGQSNITIRTLFKIVRVLNVSMAELFRS